MTLEAESRGALVFTTWTATQETDVMEFFLSLSLSVDQGILVCVKAQTACTLTSGHVFTQKLGPLHFLAFFFLSQRE